MRKKEIKKSQEEEPSIILPLKPKEESSTEEKPHVTLTHQLETKEQKKKNYSENMRELITTPVDSLIDILKVKKTASLNELSAKLGLSIDAVESIGRILERSSVVKLIYPTSVIKRPKIVLLTLITEQKIFTFDGKKVEEKKLLVDNVPVLVEIVRSNEDRMLYYNLLPPTFRPYTKIFLEEIKNKIVEHVPVEVSEITDTKKSIELKKRYFDEAKKVLREYFGSDTTLQDILAGLLLHEMYGLGIIELIMGDNDLEEVAINSSKTQITVYHKEYGWMRTNIMPISEEAIANYASQIARKVGREITTLNPLLDAHIITGDRVHASLFPISSFGNTITIRRFARRPWTIVDLIGVRHTLSIEMASLLWLAMQYEMSMLVAGGTASGKTAMLNALCVFMPPYHRIISIEDVREIMLPSYLQWNWVPMTTRNPNPEGLGEVKMLDLMHASLRMRPDRIILGEIRKKKEAEVLFEALHTGHSVYSTLHANSGQQVLRRLLEPPISLPPLEVEGLDLILVQYRDRKTNRRRSYEICEIETGTTGAQLRINTIFKWSPRTDKWDMLNKPTKLVGNINLHTGLTEQEIAEDLDGRAHILEWMLNHNISDINQVGNIMKAFYANPEEILEAAKQNKKPAIFLEA
ncbi:MAG: type II/IV secretion system ATPase subunit [Candidatus Diapherotrites archaeon]|nr:type II/IV secretion system ATPase subunit [Candidatus Diapherotrites archaeon]